MPPVVRGEFSAAFFGIETMPRPLGSLKRSKLAVIQKVHPDGCKRYFETELSASISLQSASCRGPLRIVMQYFLNPEALYSKFVLGILRVGTMVRTVKRGAVNNVWRDKRGIAMRSEF